MCITHFNARYAKCSHTNHTQYPSVHYKHHSNIPIKDPMAEPGSKENPIHSSVSRFGSGLCGAEWRNVQIPGWCLNCEWVAGGAVGLERGFFMPGL